ncbi:EamA family transporter [Candidatus Woesearchaeota archaeon]|nr:EamA family transporter [Candidatus Woesearchaeota archaeon]
MEYLWIIFALLSALTAALVAIFGKIGLQNIDSTTATAIRSIVMALFLTIIVFSQKKFNEISSIFANSKALYFIVLSGVAGALSWLFYFLALKFGTVRQVVPIDRLSIVFALVFAAIFLGEKLNLYSIIGIILITVGAIIIALN